MLKPEVDSLVPHVPFNRRTFIKAALGTGFAAAVLPVSAQTIHTDSEGLDAGEIGIRSGGVISPSVRPLAAGHVPPILAANTHFDPREPGPGSARRCACNSLTSPNPEGAIQTD